MTEINEYKNLLKCFICKGYLNDAIMCPKCHKLSCRKCIEDLFQKQTLNKCPNCQCLFNTNSICVLHNLPLMYFCKICKVALCSDCYMLNNNHKNHQIEKIDKYFDDNFQNVYKYINSLTKKSSQYIEMVDVLNKILESIDYLVEDKEKEIEIIYNEMMNNIKDKANQIKEKLSNCKKDIMSKVKLIDNRKNEFNEKYKKNDKAKMLENIDEIKQFMNNKVNENIDEELFSQIIKMDISEEISKEIIPQYNKFVELKINIFDKLNNIHCFYSNPLFYYGNYFKLKIKNNKDYLSTYLVFEKGILNHTFSFIIELYNYKNKNKSLKISNNYKFTKENEAVGYKKLISIEKIKKDGFINKNGELLIKFSVKSLTYKNLFEISQISNIKTLNISKSEENITKYNIIKNKICNETKNNFNNINNNENEIEFNLDDNDEIFRLNIKHISPKKLIDKNDKIEKKEKIITESSKFKEIEQLIKKSNTSNTNSNNNKFNILKSNENKNNKINFFKENNINNSFKELPKSNGNNNNIEIIKSTENNEKNTKNIRNNNNNEIIKSNENKEIISNGNNIDLSLSVIPQDSQYLMTDIDLTLNNDDIKDNAFARRKFVNELKYLANDSSFLPMPKNNIKNNFFQRNNLPNYDNITKNRYPLNILNLNGKDTIYPQNKFNFKK